MVFYFFVIFILISIIYLFYLLARPSKWLGKKKIAKLKYNYIVGDIVSFRKWHERGSILHVEFWVRSENLEKRYHITNHDLEICNKQRVHLCECNDTLVAINNRAAKKTIYISNKNLYISVFPPIKPLVIICVFTAFSIYSWTCGGIMNPMIFSFLLIAFIIFSYFVFYARLNKLMHPIWAHVNFENKK
ncbi:hypothetical protein [Aeromonas popoffii]|uniref:hypothetical protein n=1 Tax=Aeromonas popoffii TaxID=70856 RepID=UPI0012ECCDA4|nr:hypothetical protein [Aeromonas popoffii]